MPSGQTDSQSPLRPTSAPQCYPQHTQAPQEDRAHLAGKARVVFRAVVPVPPTGLAMDVKIAAGLPVMVVVISTRLHLVVITTAFEPELDDDFSLGNAGN